MPERARSRAAGRVRAAIAALRRRVRRLADLALEGGDRCRVDDDAALAVIVERRGAAHGGGGQPEHVEAADQVDADDLLEIGERHRSFAADDARAGRDARAVDQDAWRTEVVDDRCEDGLCRRRIS